MVTETKEWVRALQLKDFTEPNIAKAFTEWERRFREEPERFQSEAERVLRQTPESYGEAAAPYFLRILQEMVVEVVVR